MIASLKDYGGSSQGGLGRQQGSYIAWQADLHSRFSQRLQNDVDISGTAGGEGGYRVHMFFVNHDGSPYHIEKGTGGLDLLSGGELALAQSCHAVTQCTRGVGHSSNYRYIPGECFLNLAGRNRSGH